MTGKRIHELWVLALVASTCRTAGADSTVVFNEIMYHPASREAELEWVELHNQMAVDMDLSGWTLGGGVAYRFPEGTVVDGGGFVVVAISPTALEAASGFAGALGPLEGRLDNSGERLELRDNNHRLMDRVSYRDGGTWPVKPDGSGLSLAKRDPGAASRPASEWTSSAGVGGTPGAENFPVGEARPLAPIAFNETLLSAAESWVELVNLGGESLGLEGLVLRSSRDAGRELVFPAAAVLAPAGYLTLSSGELGFDLVRGDKLFLYNEERTQVLAAAMLEDGLRGRHPEGYGRWLFPEQPTPGEANRFRLHDDVVINEILYHPRPTLARPAVLESSVRLPIDAEWRFDQSGADLGSGWREIDFDDGGWARGRALLYNESSRLPAEKNTPLDLGPVTYYFRRSFEFQGDLERSRLELRHVVDDGAVFYLNGVEVGRFQMPEGEVTASTLASRSVGNARFRGPVPVPPEVVAIGRNLLAVEVHQSRETSNDVAFGLEVVEVRTVAPAVEYAESPEEWLELHNRGDQPVDLTGWRFDNGVRYDFEAGTTIGPGEYLVVTGDTRLFRAKYPGVRAVGDFDGRLSNRSDRLSLVDDRGNPVDEVRYFDRGRWHELADGLGSSLELRDPRGDNSRAESWAPSDESARSAWRTYTYEGTARSNFGPGRWNEFVFGLFDSGEVLLDDMSVVQNPDTPDAREFLQNGDFENGDASWRFLGTHRLGRVVADPENPENHVLRLIATGATEHMHNHVETTYVRGASLRNGQPYRISFRARWLAGSSQLNTRLYFNRLPRTHVLATPERSGTPGAVNSRFEENVGPTFSEFGHSPVFPADGEEVTVSVRADDPDGVDTCMLWWSSDGENWESGPMALVGGLYRGAVPWQGNRPVAFHVEGRDARGATSIFPAAGRDGRAVFKAEDTAARGIDVHTLRILVTPAVSRLLHENTNLMSNEHLPATLVVDESRVVYDVGVRLRGSERGRPDNTRTSFHLKFQPDDLFRGVHRAVSIDRSGGWASLVPRGAQDEILIKHVANHAGGIPSMYDDIGHVIAPIRSHTGRALVMMARFSSVYLDSQFENGSDGTKYTYELIYYPNSTTNGNPESLKRPLPDSVQGTDHRDLGDDKESYRWFYLLENNTQRDDYSDLMRFTKALQLSGPALDEATREAMDVDQWLRAFALYSLCGVGDTYMSGNFHNNIYYVRPFDRKVLVFPWDMDFSFVNSTSHPVVWNQHNLRKVLQLPRNTRGYYRHILDIMDTTYNRDYMSRWTRHYGELDRVNFSGILNYIGQRESFVRRGIPREVPFAITTNGGEDFTVDEADVTIDGTAWIDVATLFLREHSDAEITWPSVTRWRLSLDLEPGANALSFLAFDGAGGFLDAKSITVTRSAGESFVRGDADLDGRVNISDAIGILFHLFRGRPTRCEDAADTNDDESLDLSDAIYLLNFLFQGGPPPADPFPTAGPDPGGDPSLGCAEGLEERAG
ncbi:MAG: lamin tail domain-containing protein [Planctomycetota bacterium]|nr:lamin tail domain-containing protein [Planctomycetota bacterium]